MRVGERVSPTTEWQWPKWCVGAVSSVSARRAHVRAARRLVWSSIGYYCAQCSEWTDRSCVLVSLRMWMTAEVSERNIFGKREKFSEFQCLERVRSRWWVSAASRIFLLYEVRLSQGVSRTGGARAGNTRRGRRGAAAGSRDLTESDSSRPKFRRGRSRRDRLK